MSCVSIIKEPDGDCFHRASGPAATTPDQQISEGVRRQQNTTCYDLSSGGGIAAALTQMQTSAPTAVRIVGSCPEEQVCRRARAYLPAVLNAVQFSGSVLIGATDTRRISDPRSHVPSIPELAASLERKLGHSHAGPQPQVFGTIPINQASHLGGEGLQITADRMSDHSVRMHQGISKALWFPGRADYVWDLEAHGVVDLARRMLQERPALRYHLLMIGGGRAASLEYNRTVGELAKEFPDQVRVTLLGDTGGVTERLARRPSPECVNTALLRPRQLTRELLWLASAAESSARTRGADQPLGRGSSVPMLRDIASSNLAGATTLVGPNPPSEEALAELQTYQQRWKEDLTTGIQLRQNLCGVLRPPLDQRIMGVSEKAAWDTLTAPFDNEAHFSSSAHSTDPTTSRTAALLSEVRARVGILTRAVREQLDAFPVCSLATVASDFKPGQVLSNGDSRFMITSTARDGTTGEVILDGITAPHEGRCQPERRVLQAAEIAAGIVVETANLPPLQPGRLVDTVFITRARCKEIAQTLKLGDVLELDEKRLLILEASAYGLTVVDSARRGAGLNVRARPWSELFSASVFHLKVHRCEPLQFRSSEEYRAAVPQLLSLHSTLEFCDPTRDLCNGAIVDSALGRFVVLRSSGKSMLVSAQGGTITVSDPLVLLRTAIQSVGDVRSSLLSSHAVTAVPDSLPGWRSLAPKGGVLVYVDPQRGVVAHEEILSVAPAFRDGRELDYPWKRVRALRVVHATGDIELIDEQRHELTLVLPPAWLPQATSLEVYPSHGVRSGLLQSVPGPAEERTFVGPAQSVAEAFSALLARAGETIVEGGVQSSVTRVDRFARNPSEEAIRALRGRDSGFEEQLQQQKALFEDGRVAKELFSQFCGLIPDRNEVAFTELACLERVISSGGGTRQALVLQLDRFKLTLGQIAANCGGGLPEIAAEITLRLDRLAAALELSLEHEGSLSWVETHSGTPQDDLVLQASANLAHAATRTFAAGDGWEAKHDALRAGGGLIQNEYSTEYLRASVESGAILLVHKEQSDGTGVVRGFALLHPPGKIPERFQGLLPALRDPNRAYYEVVVSDQLLNSTSALMLARSAMITLQHTGARDMLAIINDLNSPSQRAALRDFYRPTAEQVVVLRASDGTDMPYTVWSVPVDATVRGEFPQVDPRRLRPRTPHKREAAESEAGFLFATPEERAQMLAIARQDRDAPFTRISMGVNSMHEEAQTRLGALIREGTFDGLRGVVSWGATRVATEQHGVWRAQLTGGHAILEGLKSRVASDATLVGLAPAARNDPHFGRLLTVHMPDGEVRNFLVVHTDNESGSQLSVADLTMPNLIRPIVQFPANYAGNLGIWHIEGLRSAEFSALFSDQMVLFAGGGGTIRWEINHLASLLAKNPQRPLQLVLMKGFGGAVDALCNDDEWCKAHARVTAEREKPYVRIVDVQAEPERLRELLRSSGRVAAHSTVAADGLSPKRLVTPPTTLPQV